MSVSVVFSISSRSKETLHAICNVVRILRSFAALWLLGWAAPRAAVAQGPTGTIAGTVTEASTGAIARIPVHAVDRSTQQSRTVVTDGAGAYNVSALAPGEYDVILEAPGFPRVVRLVVVEAGTVTRADVVLASGEVTADAASPAMHYDAAGVSGVVRRADIDALPLNGRNFLELAKLEPGVQPPTVANRNRTIVPTLGAPAQNITGPRFTIDGATVTSVALGGAQMAFSQDAVQEFQIATVNPDLSAGLTYAGAVNVVTRSGGNAVHGDAFYFFRDHHLSAYPFLFRDNATPDPFFDRRQFGVAGGGPLRRDLVFVFADWEQNVQRAAAATTLLAPDFAALSRVTASPLTGDLVNVRVDAKVADAHSVFVRYSHDGSRAFGPAASVSGGSANAYPSTWNHVTTTADQAVVGFTSVPGRSLVSELRLSFFAVSSRVSGADAGDCGSCLGIGAPAISIQQAGLTIGNSSASDNLEHRIELSESVTWQKTAHRIHAGIDWEWNRDRNLVWPNDPVSLTVFQPDRVRQFNARVPPDQQLALPASFLTLNDILQLPVRSVMVDVGDPAVTQEGGGDTRRWSTPWLYAEDTWRVRNSLTLTSGLGWGTDGVLNHDLSKPPLLAPILGANGLGPTRMNGANISPAASVTWTPWPDGDTVLHAAIGRFFGPQGLTSSMDNERVALGPPGLGQQQFAGSSILSPLVRAGTPVDFSSPTAFTAANLLAILPALRASLAQLLANGDPNVKQIQITKESGPAIFPESVPNPSAIHINAGVQRRLPRDFILSADVVYRRFTHVPQSGGAFDSNHYESVAGPVIPKCGAAQAADPEALCSNGPIDVQFAPFWFTYKGLLLRLEKRVSTRLQVLGSYALSRNSGTNAATGSGSTPGLGFNLYNWVQNTGPTATDVTHLINIAGSARLPWELDLSANFSFASAPPFSAYLGGYDLNGDGTSGDLLPGSTVNAFGRGLGPGDLERLVASFNAPPAKTDAKGVVLPTLTLPSSYAFGDSTQALDLRLSRRLPVGGRMHLTLMAEAFNIYNAPNLSGYSGDLTSATTFGQPTGRSTQIFGSAGPRSFQLAARMQF